MAIDRAGLRLVVMLGLTAAGLGSAHAGGVNFGDDNDNGASQGPYFFGFVRDSNGSSVPDAKVIATVKAGGALVTRTNSMGVYKIPGFGKDTDPDSVEISCAKEGYQQDNVVRRPHAAGDDIDPVEVECTLKKE
jgi:hypothetical protein